MATLRGFHRQTGTGRDLEYCVEYGPVKDGTEAYYCALITYTGQAAYGSIDRFDGIVTFDPTSAPIELAVRTTVTNYINGRTYADLPYRGPRLIKYR